MCRSAAGRVFLYFWERLEKGFQEVIVSFKAVQEVLDMKYKSEFKHRFTNCGCLQSAILKGLHGFQEKRAHKSKGMQFFFQNVQSEIFKIFKVFKNNVIFTRAAC